MEINNLKIENTIREHIQQCFEPFVKENQQLDTKLREFSLKINLINKRLDEYDFVAYKQRKSIKDFEEYNVRTKKLVATSSGTAQVHIRNAERRRPKENQRDSSKHQIRHRREGKELHVKCIDVIGLKLSKAAKEKYVD